jgi:hypothetical protein
MIFPLVARNRSSVESPGARCPSDRILHQVVTNASKRTIFAVKHFIFPGQILCILKIHWRTHDRQMGSTLARICVANYICHANE